MTDINDQDHIEWFVHRGINGLMWVGLIESVVASGSDLPPTRMPFTLHSFGVSMGYTCSAFTRWGIRRKMARCLREAGCSPAQVTEARTLMKAQGV